MFGITHSDLSKHSITYLMASVLKLMIMSRVRLAWLEIGEFHPIKTEKTVTFKAVTEIILHLHRCSLYTASFTPRNMLAVCLE